MSEMEKRVDQCSFGLEFLIVLRDYISDEQLLDALDKTADEFKEEQSRVSRRSSIAQHDANIDGGEFKDELQFRHQSIPEAPEKPDLYKSFTLQVAPSDIKLIHADQPIQQLSSEEDFIMNRFIDAVQQTNGTGDSEAVLIKCDELLKYYEQQMKQVELAHCKETKELQADVEHHKKLSEERGQHLAKKDCQLEQAVQKLEKTQNQLASKEKEFYHLQLRNMKEEKAKKDKINKLQVEKEDMKKECATLKQQLDEKFKELECLERTIKEQQLELEMQMHTNAQLLQLSQYKTKRTDKKVVEKTIEQWQKIKGLVNQLFEKDSDITQVKIAIVQKVNAVKHTGLRRHSMVHITDNIYVN